MGEYDRIIVDELQKIKDAIGRLGVFGHYKPRTPDYSVLLVVIILELVVIIVKS